MNKAKPRDQRPTRQPNSTRGNPCFWCGTIPYHNRQVCPARDATCRKCSKKGHFQTVCRGDTRVRGVRQEETPPPSEESTDTFLGAVGENPWVVIVWAWPASQNKIESLGKSPLLIRNAAKILQQQHLLKSL